jgi:hypothetical protein
MNTRVLTLIPVLAVVLTLVPATQAASPCVGLGGNAWLYPGFWYNLYGMESLPYFALHPPVYYSQPVPRTYGWSPFAYPPGTMTPEVEVVQPQVMRNPHVEQRATMTADKFTLAPLRIRNPYVVDSNAQLSQAD